MGVAQTCNCWRDKGISDDLLKSFWRRLWASDMPEKIKVWFWLLSHKAIPVGEWMRSRGGEAGCTLCGHSLESIPHCFWNCVSIWGRSLRIVAACGVNGRVVWGSLQGLKLTKEGWAEQLNPHGHGFIVQGSSVFKCVGVEPGTNSGFFEEIWMLVACFSVWHIWTRRCMFVFQQRKLPSGEVLLNIWFELVSWLRGQYNSIVGNSDEAERARSKFLLKWGRSPMMVNSASGPKWNYQAPRWLFPPLASMSGQEL